MAAKIATLVLVLSALLLILSVGGGWDAVTMLVTVVGSLAAGLLYGRAWSWKSLAMSIAIAIIYSAAAFTGIILWLQTRPPTGDFLAGIAGVGVIIIGGISLILAIIGGIIGAILHRRRRIQQ
jgi:hypothetical protein